jgi:hypothetical protein
MELLVLRRAHCIDRSEKNGRSARAVEGEVVLWGRQRECKYWALWGADRNRELDGLGRSARRGDGDEGQAIAAQLVRGAEIRLRCAALEVGIRVRLRTCLCD